MIQNWNVKPVYAVGLFGEENVNNEGIAKIDPHLWKLLETSVRDGAEDMSL